MVGRTSSAPQREHAHVSEVRTPRVAVVFAATESITEPPLTAAAKAAAEPEAAPVAVAAPAPHRPPARRAGFQRPANLHRH
jgi:hypothetical protein